MIIFLRRIASLCKDYPKIRENLIRENVIKSLLHLLMDSADEELQSASLHFLSILFRYRADQEEVKNFFEIFVQNVSLVPQFVEALLNIISDGSVENILPSFFMNFPQQSSFEGHLPSNSELDEWTMSMQELQNCYVPSPWKRSCLILSAARQHPCECIWLTGFSASFWLKYGTGPAERMRPNLMAKNSSSEMLIHVLSFGSDSTLLEIWIDEKKSCFAIRLTLVQGRSIEMLYSGDTISRPVDFSCWNLMAFSVSSETKNEKISLKIKVMINGTYEQIFQVQLNNEKLPTHLNNERIRVLIGDHVDASSNFQGSYEFGNFMMFRSDILNKAYCLAIRGYGPDLENFLASSASAMKSNSNSSVFVSHDAEDVDFLDFMQNCEKYTERLRKHMIISFTPRAPQYFYHYLPLEEAQTTTKRYPTSCELSPECHLMDEYCVQSIKILRLHSVSRQHSRTFRDYILDVGGFSFVAFLLAKVVELSECKIVHANTLKFVLKICSSNSYLHSQLTSRRGYDLISSVIDTPRFCPSEISFIVLLEATCSELFAGTDIRTLHFPNNMRVYNPKIITTLILPHWRRWHRSDPHLLIVFFENLCQFIHPRNIHRSFNAQILTSHGIVEKILNLCREKFQNKENGGDVIVTPNGENAGSSCVDQNLNSVILEFLESIISLLHSIDHIKQVAEFLLATHPSSAAAVLRVKPSSDEYFWLDEWTLKETSEQRFAAFAHPERVGEVIAEFLIKYENGYDSKICADETDMTDFHIDDWESVEDCSVVSNVTNFCRQCQTNFYESLLGKDVPSCDDSRDFLASGLLNIFHNTILVMPDTIWKIVRRDIINSDFLSTLANHSHPSVREAVVRIVNSCVIHDVVSVEEADHVFDEIPEGFHILADQLSSYPVTEELVNGCISLISPHCSLLSYPDEPVEVPLYLFASPPLLALLPKSVPNFPAAISGIRFIKLLIKRVPHALEKLIENGLVDRLLKSVQIIIHTSVCDPCRLECANPLLLEIMDLFTVIIRTCLQNFSKFSNVRVNLFNH